MSVYPNPFHARASEHQREAHRFISTFGAGAVSMLPEALWDRLLILRSSPGAGKTSLMRLFTIDSLLWVRGRLRDSDPLREELANIGALVDGEPTRLGVLLDLDRDYRALLDLPIREDVALRLFLRLLDTRIMLGVLRAALLFAGEEYPGSAELFRLEMDSTEPDVEAAVEWIGGTGGGGILNYARDTERRVLGLLNALLTSDLEADPQAGHHELMSLRVLSACAIRVGNRRLGAQPLLMFDDGHALDNRQRSALLEQLGRRRPSPGRWYSERFEALSDQELLQSLGTAGRDHVLVNLDHIARAGNGRRFHKGRHDRVLVDIATRRAAPVLKTYAQEEQDFFSLLDPPDSAEFPQSDETIGQVRERALALSGGKARYDRWVAEAAGMAGRTAALKWRELEILITRDREREQDLFERELTPEDLDDRSSASLREGAEVSLANEFNLPFYAGQSRILQLGSHNTEQFLNLCGDLFEELLVSVSVGRRPTLAPRRQDRLLRDASERYWESIPRTVPSGRDVQAIVSRIVEIAKAEANKPTMPYPPGVTGTAMLMSERTLLLDPAYREANPGADRLLTALASAVASNVLAADLDYAVKGNRYMVIYLNRLLCPRFGLPLGRGSFRERRLSTMLGWVRNLPAAGQRSERQLSL